MRFVPSLHRAVWRLAMAVFLTPAPGLREFEPVRDWKVPGAVALPGLRGPGRRSKGTPARAACGHLMPSAPPAWVYARFFG